MPAKIPPDQNRCTVQSVFQNSGEASGRTVYLQNKLLGAQGVCFTWQQYKGVLNTFPADCRESIAYQSITFGLKSIDTVELGLTIGLSFVGIE